jgi:hypothetical protein
MVGKERGQFNFSRAKRERSEDQSEEMADGNFHEEQFVTS